LTYYLLEDYFRRSV